MKTLLVLAGFWFALWVILAHVAAWTERYYRKRYGNTVRFPWDV